MPSSTTNGPFIFSLRPVTGLSLDQTSASATILTRANISGSIYAVSFAPLP